MLSIDGRMERLTRLELALRAWKALVLPLHHSRISLPRLCQQLPLSVQRFLVAMPVQTPEAAVNRSLFQPCQTSGSW